ncbi:hypothetical protein G6O67_002769 [Ophiocordyceps sinensis]|uniref:Uncharacterized protein n=1 Tax=Ophiocordyceps sinensis TaxID=72228 RepID=A0A8H4PUX8_9HYPO|nr:hypothetical protein G6O67_002769 [Ophiocordyceps sinensis]
MNPLATEFTPSTSPETRVSQLATRSPQRLVEKSRHDSRYYSQQESIGSAPTGRPFRPRLTHPYRFATAPDGVTPFPDAVWGQGAHDDRYHPPVGPPGWQEAAPCFPEALLTPTNQGFGYEAPCDVPIMTVESNGRNTRPVLFPIGLNFRPASGAGEADSGSSYTTESLAHSRSTVTQWTPAVHQYYPGMEHHHHHEHFLPGDREADGSTVQMGAATSAFRRGYMLAEQLEARSTHHLPQPANRQESGASGPQQMPFPGSWIPPQLGPDVYNAPSAPDVHPSLDLRDQDWPPLQPLTARVGSTSKSQSQRGPSTRRLSRLGGTKRHRLQQDVNSRNQPQVNGDENEGILSETCLNPRSERQSSHGWPSHHVQQQDTTRSALQASTPIPTVSTSTDSIRLSDPAPLTPSHSQTRGTSVAAVDPNRAALADIAELRHRELRHRELATQRGLDDHQNRHLPPKHNQPSTIRQQSKAVETSAPDHSRDWTGDEFRFRGTPHALEPGVQLDIVREAVIPQRPPALPRPSDEPQPRDAYPSRGHQLGHDTSHFFDARMVSCIAAAPREVSRASGTEAQSSRTRASVEPGSWTNSKRWMSQEMKDRQAFAKMMNNLRHMGAEKSPCIPQTMTELAAFRAEMAEEERKQLTRVFRRRIAELELRRDLLQTEPQGAGPAIDKLLWGRRFQDGASPVFASDNCFNDEFAIGYGIRVDWPSLAELKEEGERRGGRYRRCLPLPRLNAIDPRVLTVSNADVLHPDGTIRWQAKAVSPNRACIMPVSPPET